MFEKNSLERHTKQFIQVFLIQSQSIRLECKHFKLKRNALLESCKCLKGFVQSYKMKELNMNSPKLLRAEVKKKLFYWQVNSTNSFSQ